jgi:uncharacterized alpha-E superfamily protein
MARYVERAENLARILDINETFARDARGDNDWLPILKLHCDEESYLERYRHVEGGSIVRFYLIDEKNPNSIHNSVRAARENARSIRHLISLETWTQLNVFYNWIRSLNSRTFRLTELSRVCSQIKEGCQLHFGIANSTLFRDQVWLFYRLGTFIELCDQTTRLVDIKYHSLLPSAYDVGTPIDVAQWNALLRYAAAYHGYRRVYPHEMTPTTVAGFILFDRRFPRSISHCVAEIRSTLEQLLQQEELSGVEFSMASLESLEALAAKTPKEVIAAGLHEFLDDVQILLSDLGGEVSDTFFMARYAAA